MRVWATALLVLAVALAGCSDGDKKSDQNEDDEFKNLNVQATDDTGVIRGVVVDVAIRPLAGATVTVIIPESEPKVMQTGEDGLFAFDGLAPGDYFITVEKLGYFKVQQNVAVVAGVADPKAVRILLETDAENFPYYSVQTFSGFMECSSRAGAPGVGSIGLNACDGTGNQQTNFVLEFDAKPTFVQAEMTWESTQTAGNGLSLVVGPASCADVKWGRSDGPSPRILALNETAIDAQEGDGSAEATCYRVFAWTSDESGNTAGVTASQEFQIIVHTFYNYAPPEGWTFINDGEPPGPE